MQTFCQMDGKPIPPERMRRNARTCSKECQKAYRRQYEAAKREKYRMLREGAAMKKNTISVQAEAVG